ncbi:MAG: hypothetical protein JWM12_2096 [Ilumatobacteraceae bacterium]|nr:hypothetical protein [Ilumatobacteraceae bacterium]
MPAVTVNDTLILPRIPRPDPATSKARPAAKVDVPPNSAGCEDGARSFAQP